MIRLKYVCSFRRSFIDTSDVINVFKRDILFNVMRISKEKLIKLEMDDNL